RPTRPPARALSASTVAGFFFFWPSLFPFPGARPGAPPPLFPSRLPPATRPTNPPPPTPFRAPADVTNGLADREGNPSRYYWARQREDLMSPPKETDKPAVEKWVHLLDGGLADNIGLRSILRAYDRTSGFIRSRINAGHIKRFVVIVINARTDPPEQLSRREGPPGLVDVFMTTATVSMETVT